MRNGINSIRAVIVLCVAVSSGNVSAQTRPGGKLKLGITPAVKTFEINYGDALTSSQSVTLNNTLVNAGSASQYRASENASFTGASWIAYSSAPSFNLSSGDGQKTVYLQVKNDSGTSGTISDSITYQRLPSVTSFKISGDAATTSSQSVSISNTTTGVATHCRVSEDVNFSGASWQSYCGSSSFGLSSGAGQKTVYFQTKNNNGSSNIATDVINLAPPIVTQVLDYNKAKQAGATFIDGSDCQAGGGQADWNQGCSTCQPGVWFRALSTLAIGCKATPEAYVNFTLKNGWTVKEVQVVELAKTGVSDWQWKSPPPSTGSSSPYLKMHLWADAFSDIHVGVKIVIQGPEGTDPYQ